MNKVEEKSKAQKVKDDCEKDDKDDGNISDDVLI